MGTGRTPLPPRERRQLGLLVIGATLTLLSLAVTGLVVERSAHTQLIAVGQPAPEFALPATTGDTISLRAAQGEPVLLGFVPSVLCAFCQQQLRALQAALPELQARNIQVYVVSTDTPAVQRTAAEELGLTYPLLSEAPTAGQHPVGSAYGVYHAPHGNGAPVDVNAFVVIDAAGTVRAVRVQPGKAISEHTLLALVDGALSRAGGVR